jgi:hypothetical protein
MRWVVWHMPIDVCLRACFVTQLQIKNIEIDLLNECMRLFLLTANVDYVIITDDDNLTSDAAHHFDITPDRHKPTLVYVEGQRGTLRCIAVGGQPTPVVSIQMAANVGLSSSAPIIRSIDMPQSVSVAVHGRRGLRLLRQMTERTSTTFETTTDDDGSEVKCFAMITGLPPRVATSRIAVHCTELFLILCQLE